MQRKAASAARSVKKISGKIPNTKGKVQNYKKDPFSKIKTNPPKK